MTPRLLFSALTAIGLAAPAAAQLYDFTINPVTSGLTGPLSIEAQTAGTLIGDFDEVSNPTGTRTKPGVFGTFGPTENVPVPTSLGLGVGGQIASRTSGGFRLDFNPALGTVSMSNFAANFLQSGPVNLPITLSLLFDSFRTRNPTSTYIGGIPLNVPLGEASLTQMSGVQSGPGAGTLTPTGPNTYDFSIGAVMLLTAEFSALGNPFLIPAAPTPIGLSGSVTLDGTSATLTSLTPVVFSGSNQPNLPLPQFPLDLPTILPPGETAHLLLDLTLSEISFTFDGTSAINATGALVPAPASATLMIAGLALGIRRRR